MSAKPALGLFLTDRMMEISRVSVDGKRLEKFGAVALAATLVVNGEIQSPKEFVAVLKQLMAVTKPRPVRVGEEVVIGIPDNRVFLRVFTLPAQAGKEIEEAVEFRIRTLEPLMPSEVETDWQIIGQDADGQIEVLLAAVPKKIIASYRQVAEAAGLVVVAVEPAVFANIRVVDQKFFKGKNQLLVHVSANYAEFTYLTNLWPRFSDFLSDSDIAKKGNIFKVIADYVSFANSKHPVRPVQEVVVSGSHPQLEIIVKNLVERKIAAVLAKSRLSSSAIADQFLLRTTYGLSLRSVESDGSFNLLPLDYRQQAVKRELVKSWQAVVNVLIIVTLVLNGVLAVYYSQLKNRGVALKNLKVQIQDQLSQEVSKNLVTEAEKVNLLVEQLVVLRESVGGEEKILQQLSEITPTGVSLSSVSFIRDLASVRLVDPKSSWMIVGKAASRPVVLNFYQQLTALPEFNGRLFFGSLSKDTGITFKIANNPNQ